MAEKIIKIVRFRNLSFPLKLGMVAVFLNMGLSALVFLVYFIYALLYV